MRKTSHLSLKAVHQIALAALCLLILGSSVIPGRATAQQVSTHPQPLVAIHVSEHTQALEAMPAVGSTPTGTGTSGYQWWYTSWHYFVAYESLEEALRADGTPFVEVTDADIASGVLLNEDGSPRYPIMFSLDSEAIDDSEINPLLAYVNAGGFLFVGSTSFTRNLDGTTRGDFALAGAMGLHLANPILNNFYLNQSFTKAVSHRLTDHIPGGKLTWRMPLHADEIPEGVSSSYHQLQAGHYTWQVNAGDATVIANGDSGPYLTVKTYGKGQFIYDGAFQPIIGHGEFNPGMYAYLIFRRAIEWAFESDSLPIAKVSPWPYAYDAASIVRHDFENDQAAIDAIQASAQYESVRGVKGDYFFCTGAVREDMSSYQSQTAIAGIQTAVRSYGATIGSHNGGFKNPQNASLTRVDFDYWHWGPDEALDTTPPGYTNGKDYATQSIALSYHDIEVSWLTGLDNGRTGCGAAGNCPRLWAAPYFNSTRDDSVAILDQLGAVVMGEQKIGPFPHKTLSYKTRGKYYAPVTLPVSDWYKGTSIPTALEDLTVVSMQNAVDFYYGIGALINLYGHVPSSKSGSVEQQYVQYIASSPTLTYLWRANSIGIADWSISRSNISAAPVYTVTGNVASIRTTVTGPRDENSAIEIVIPNWVNLARDEIEVLRNNVPANPSDYRLTSYGVKVKAGASVSTVEVRYVPAPLSSVSVSPSSVQGGVFSQGTVTLRAAAPDGGVTISLSSNRPTTASVPSTVLVPAGSASASFTITTYPVAASTIATITADDGENQKIATLTVTPPVLSSFTITPTTVLGGIISQGTVTLTGAAPSGGLAVTLSSNHSSIASVPASVQVPAGSTSATFTITTYPVANSTLVTISASGGAATATLTVTPPVLDSLSISPGSVYGGIASHGTVTLTGAAPSGGVSITLSSDTPSVASVPASVVVPAGSTSAAFSIATNAVSTSTLATLSATFSGATRTASLTVMPPVLNSIGVNPISVVGGIVSQGTVTLSGPAPNGGVSITLSSDTPSVASVPGSVIVPAGSASASFAITTNPVSGPTPVVITAVCGDATLTATLIIGPTSLNSIAVSPTSVLGGLVSQGTVTLTGAAPIGGASISLSSDNPSVGSVPTSVLVPAGSTSVSFTIATNPVAGSTPVIISAVYSGVTRTTSLTVGPPAVTSLAVNPVSVLGGLISQGTVTLNGPAPENGLTVSLNRDNPAAVVPQTITVPAGSTSASFAITTSPVATSTPVTISASLGGTATAILTVTPPAVNAVSVDPTSVLGGIVSHGTVTLTGAAPAGGLSISLGSGTPTAASVPATILVPGGSTSASFLITTYPVANSTQVTISAIFGNTMTTTLTVTPPVVNAISVNPSSVLGGVVSHGTVTLTGAAPTGGLSISLGSDTPTAAGVPSTVTVPAGSTSATFLITTYPVAISTQVTISASFGGTMTAMLAVMPPVLNSFSISPSSVAGGVVSHGTVTLTGAAPNGGLSVSLSSDTPTAASVPSAVVVPAGSTSASFLITTYPVAGSTPATITASQGGVIKTAQITIVPLALSSLTTNPVSVLGGNTSQGTVTLNGPAPNGGMSISLSSDTPTAAGVPATVTVLAGSTSALFTITTSPVAGATFVTITASDGKNTKTASITVTLSGVSSLSVNPSSVAGGIISHGTLTLTGAAPAGGVTVSLSSGVTSAAGVPSTVMVPAGSTSASFTITTYPVANSYDVVITASYGSTATATLTVTPPAVNALSINPSSVLGGIVSQGTVTLTGSAPSGGVSVSLTSNTPLAAGVPAAIVVPAGSTSASFTITTYPVANSTPVTISATSGGTVTAGITVAPPYVSSLSISPASVLGGIVSHGTVTLTGSAPTGGMMVMLGSNTPSTASVPTSVMVPAGGTGASFLIITAPVSGPTQVTISSTCSNATKTYSLTVNPPDGYLVGSDMTANALKALRIAAGLDKSTQADLIHGDVAPLANGQPHPDGKIDLADVVAILRKAAGLPSW